MTSTDEMSPTVCLPLDEEGLANAKKRVERLRHTNSVLVRNMENAGAGIDFQAGMIETYFEALVEIGALREDQYVVMKLIWEERFNKQLTTMKGQLEKAIEQARMRAKLAVPGRQNGQQQQLIIPGT